MYQNILKYTLTFFLTRSILQTCVNTIWHSRYVYEPKKWFKTISDLFTYKADIITCIFVHKCTRIGFSLLNQYWEKIFIYILYTYWLRYTFIKRKKGYWSISMCKSQKKKRLRLTQTLINVVNCILVYTGEKPFTRYHVKLFSHNLCAQGRVNDNWNLDLFNLYNFYFYLNFISSIQSNFNNFPPTLF